jgi:hypothetical protein
MIDDPIVDGIRKCRDDHAKKFNYNLDLIVKALQQDEKKSSDTFVNPGPKRILNKTATAQNK